MLVISYVKILKLHLFQVKSMNNHCGEGHEMHAGIPVQPPEALGFESLYEQLRQHEAAVSNGKLTIQKEIERFIIARKSLSCDPIQFWRDTTDFPLLRSVAETVLPVPATSAPVERVFSQAGLCCSKRYTLSSAMLIKEVMLRMNKHLLQ